MCVADGWSELLRELGFIDSDLGQHSELDISLAHPWNKAVLMKASKEEGAAASNSYQEGAGLIASP